MQVLNCLYYDYATYCLLRVYVFSLNEVWCGHLWVCCTAVSTSAIVQLGSSFL